ncbi:RidA family protein [Lacicoccus qingdaonensis]|uniref:2-iminobutanoate/2-iminopropanoate deaminase n=1 Tax=Lacicoccus qingdaonensis TaxID=576118 RepID=A0A1G9JAU8_9BACL|nr:Rid family detoxifying hydrolase [Salinicoccus qingdaonensis]SDL34568.1 2-iminobutanoate/2-iminopropanoate deaminase [Salinicoccus qingdaonensis]
MKEIIKTENAPTPGGHFSQGIKINNRIYVAGQTPVDPKTGEIPKTVEEQTRLSLTNIKNVLEAGGAKLEDVVKVNAYLTNVDDFKEYDKVYQEFFVDNLPVRTTIGCDLKGIPLEIDAIAEL